MTQTSISSRFITEFYGNLQMLDLNQAIEKTESTLNLQSGHHKILFTEQDLLLELEKYIDDLPANDSTTQDLLKSETSITKKVRILTLQRMKYKEYKECLLKLQPIYSKILSLKTAINSADFIWNHLKIRDIDWNFYSKRMILAKIIAQAKRKLIQENYESCEKSVDNSMQSIRKFAKLKQSISWKNIKKNIPFIRLW